MKRLIIVIIAMAVLMTLAQGSYAGMDDRSDRMSNEQSNVFSPGYINATRQRTDQIINQANPKRSFFERATDYVKAKLGKDLEEDSANKVEPDLRKKKGGGDGSNSTESAAVSRITGGVIDLGLAGAVLKEAIKNGQNSVQLENGNTITAWAENGKTYFKISDSSQKTLLDKMEFTGSEQTAFDYNAAYKAKYDEAYREAYDSVYDNYCYQFMGLIAYSGGYGASLGDVTADLSYGQKEWYDQQSDESKASAASMASMYAGNYADSFATFLASSYASEMSMTYGSYKLANLSYSQDGAFSVDLRKEGGLTGQAISDAYKDLYLNGYLDYYSDTAIDINHKLLTFSGESLYQDYFSSAYSSLYNKYYSESFDSLYSFYSSQDTYFDSSSYVPIQLLSDSMPNSNAGSYYLERLNVVAPSIWDDHYYHTADPSFIALHDTTSPLASFGSTTALVSTYTSTYTSSSTSILTSRYTSTSTVTSTSVSTSTMTSTSTYISTYTPTYTLVSTSTSTPTSTSMSTSTSTPTSTSIPTSTYTYTSILTSTPTSTYISTSISTYISTSTPISTSIYFSTSTSTSVSTSTYTVISKTTYTISTSEAAAREAARKAYSYAGMEADWDARLNTSMYAANSAISTAQIAALSKAYSYVADNISAVKSTMMASSEYKQPTEDVKLTKNAIMPTAVDRNINSTDFRNINDNPSLKGDMTASAMYMKDDSDLKTMGGGITSTVFKELLSAKGDVLMGEGGKINEGFILNVVDLALKQYALAMPAINASEARENEIQVALILASILKNPTEEQKMIIAAAEALLTDINNMEGDAKSPELNKAADNLIQVMAAVLIAQAMPDLFTETDVLAVRSVFAELGSAKAKIFLNYQESTRPYYERIVKELANNMNILQMNNIISGNISREDLENMPRSDIDKIMENLKKAKDRSTEEEGILRKEEEYRKQYLDPNKKMMEDSMKSMMNDFTRRLSLVLESAKPAKK